MKRILSFLLPLVMVSCSFGTELSGIVDTRVVEDPGIYTEIVVKGSVNVTMDPTATAITLTGDTVLTGAASVVVKDGNLTVDASRKQFKRKGIKSFIKVNDVVTSNAEALDVVIPAPVALSEITLAGAVNFTSAEPVKAGKLAIETAGANNVNLVCDVKELEVDAAGADNYWLEGSAVELNLDMAGACNFCSKSQYLTVNKAKVDLAGACSATLCCVGTVKGDLAGACSLSLTGAGDSKVKSRGASSVIRF